MSDLAATNCGNSERSGNGNNLIWIILILLFCGGCDGLGSGLSLSNAFGDNSSCDIILWLLLLSSLSGRNGNGYGCGCGC